MKKNIAYIFLNGDLMGDAAFYENYIKNNPGDFFCADGGYNHCKTLNISPLEVWGDLDSINNDDIKNLKDNKIPVIQFNKDKDFTDGELIIESIYKKNYEKIIIIGGLGGRLSHTLTNLSFIIKYQNTIFLTEKEEVFFVNKKHTLTNLKGITVSFIPFSSDVEFLTLEGFKYPLLNHKLILGSSICMSNIVSDNLALITYSKGYLIGIKEFSIDNL